ncbi:hypothetical protein GVAV_002143 [Gurleya vavrai]
MIFTFKFFCFLTFLNGKSDGLDNCDLKGIIINDFDESDENKILHLIQSSYLLMEIEYILLNTVSNTKLFSSNLIINSIEIQKKISSILNDHCKKNIFQNIIDFKDFMNFFMNIKFDSSTNDENNNKIFVILSNHCKKVMQIIDLKFELNSDSIEKDICYFNFIFFILICVKFEYLKNTNFNIFELLINICVSIKIDYNENIKDLKIYSTADSQFESLKFDKFLENVHTEKFKLVFWFEEDFFLTDEGIEILKSYPDEQTKVFAEKIYEWYDQNKDKVEFYDIETSDFNLKKLKETYT